MIDQLSGGDQRGGTRQVVVFRNNLFRVSEPFITDQAQHLQRYTPLYLGRKRFGAAPAGAQSLALEDAGRWASLPRIAWQTLSRNPAPYRRLLEAARPALIHAHFGTDAVYALPLAQSLGIPLITTFHGFDATLSTPALLSSPAWMNYPLFRGRLARHGDLFLCVSSFIRDQVLARGFPADRTHVHYTGVDCEAIRLRDPNEETRTILQIGRLVEMKGTRYLLRAFAALAARTPDVDLVIIGDGALSRALRAQAAALNLGGRIRFLGALPHQEALAWIRRAAMLVLPSVLTATGRVEGLGMVLLEAAATGVPVVASRVGGIPDGVIDGQTGLLVPQRDAAALSEAMGRLLDEPATRLRMRAAARAFVEQKFDLGRQNAALEALYDRVRADHAAGTGRQVRGFAPEPPLGSGDPRPHSPGPSTRTRQVRA